MSNSIRVRPVVEERRCGQNGFAQSAGRFLVMALGVLLPASMASAQRAYDHPISAVMPAVFENHSFVDGDNFAVLGEGVVHLFRGASVAPSAGGILGHQRFEPTGSQAMVAPWAKLSKSCALYLSCGADGIPETADDELQVIQDLPVRPVITTASLYGMGAESFIPLTDGVAVRLDEAGQSCLMLEYNRPIPLSTFVTLPFALDLNTPEVKWGRVNETTIMGLVPGTDGDLLSGDDLIAVVTDLDPQRSATTLTASLPAGFLPAGFFVTEGGTGIAWQRTAVNRVELLVVRFNTSLQGIDMSILPIQFLETPRPGWTPDLDVVNGLGDTMRVGLEWEAGPGFVYRLVGDFHASPSERGEIRDDWNCGCTHRQVGSTDFVFYSSRDPVGFRYHDYWSGYNFQLSFPWDNELRFVKPTRTSLVALSDMPPRPGFNVRHEARAVVLTAPGDPIARRDVAVSIDGRWAGGGRSQVTGEEMGTPVIVLDDGGSIAGFVDTDGDGIADYLRRITVPSASIAEKGLATSDALVRILTTNVPPAYGQTGYLTIDSPPSWNQGAFVVASFGRKDEPLELAPPVARDGSQIWVDLEQAFLMDSIPVGANAPLPIAAPPALRVALGGKPLYLQAVMLDPQGRLVPSDLFRLVMD